MNTQAQQEHTVWQMTDVGFVMKDTFVREESKF